MKTIASLFNFLILLALALAVTFAAAYFVPAHLQETYAGAEREIFENPAKLSRDFDTWAAATEDALRHFHHKREQRKWLVMIVYPGYRGEVVPLARDLQQTVDDYATLIADLRELFRNNAMLRRAWEQAVLTNPEGDGLSAGGVARGLMGVLSTLGNTGDAMKRFVDMQERRESLQNRIEQLRQQLAADRATFELGFPAGI
jgi:hypothetical protein